MPLDIHRHGDEFLVSVDLPGVDPESIEVTVEKDLLTVSARREWQPDAGEQVLSRERAHGTFTRRLRLSQRLNAEGVRASYDRGVLTLVVPVAEAAKPRRIPVSSGDAQQAAALDAETTEPSGAGEPAAA
jgi:HSP20 family protein